MSSIDFNTYQKWRRTYYRRKDVRIYTNSVLILLSFSILILAAIQPTVITIIDLYQKIQSSRELVDRMDRKIVVLRKLQDNYLKVVDELPLMDELFPKETSGAYLGRVIKVYVYKHNLKLKSLSFSGYKWPHQPTAVKTKAKTRTKSKTKTKKDSRVLSYGATVTLSGDYQDLVEFMEELEKLRLIIKLESFNLKSFKNETVLTGRITLKNWYDQT
ncbi:MAG: hypothetical protein GXP43_00395 [bacterium]|nr:hypothetical protein [bacterium]